MKAIHSLAALLDDPTLPVKDSPLLRTSKDLLDFSAALRSTDSLRRIFRIIMDNLISASTKNAVFFAEKLYTLMDKSPIATYLLGTLSSSPRRVLLRQRRLPQGVPALPDEPRPLHERQLPRARGQGSPQERPAPDLREHPQQTARRVVWVRSAD